LLMTLAFNLGKYTEAYYYADLLSLAKCNWVPDAAKVKQKTSDVIRRKGESKNFPKPLITGATKWLKHLTQSVQEQIVALLGPAKATALQKEGTNARFEPCWE
jgi:hypothetical protein